jgi:hypothetical protein
MNFDSAKNLANKSVGNVIRLVVSVDRELRVSEQALQPGDCLASTCIFSSSTELNYNSIESPNDCRIGPLQQISFGSTAGESSARSFEGVGVASRGRFQGGRGRNVLRQRGRWCRQVLRSRGREAYLGGGLLTEAIGSFRPQRDLARFVSHVTPPDGATLEAGVSFIKVWCAGIVMYTIEPKGVNSCVFASFPQVWRLRNDGVVDWPSKVELVRLIAEYVSIFIRYSFSNSRVFLLLDPHVAGRTTYWELSASRASYRTYASLYLLSCHRLLVECGSRVPAARMPIARWSSGPR